MIPTLFKKLLFARQFHYEDGRFYLMMNVPGIILPMRVLVKICNEIMKKKGGSKALYNIGYEHGMNAGLRYKTYMVSSFLEALKFMEELVETLGFGRVKLVKVDKKKVIAHFQPSTFAEVWRKEYGISKKPVCYYNAGIFAGFLSGFMGREYQGIETKCIAKGDPYCEIVGGVHGVKDNKAGKLRSKKNVGKRSI